MYGTLELKLSTIPNHRGELHSSLFTYLIISMKFETKNQRKEYPNHNDSGETLVLHIRGVIPVSIRQQAMEISADMAGMNSNIELNEDGTMKDVKMDSEQVQMLSKNISRIYSVTAEMLVDWNAEDEEGKKLDINPDTVSLVLGDTICMEVV